MADALSVVGAVSGVVRTTLLAGGVAFAAIATADWAARTRRINPFSGLARFTRTRVDPRLEGGKINRWKEFWDPAPMARTNRCSRRSIT